MHLVASKLLKQTLAVLPLCLSCNTIQNSSQDGCLAVLSPEEPLDSAGKIILVVRPEGKGERGTLRRIIPTSFKN